MEKSNSSSFTSSNSRPLLHIQTPLFSLPEGWGVEEIPRSYGSKSDKYYLEPETGKRFRSLREVERHLNGETVTRTQKSTQLIASNPPQIEEWFVRPPSKVNWALASPKGNAWNPIVGDTLISNAVKQQWRKRFVSAMNNNNESSAVIPTERPQLTTEQPQIEENIQQTQSGEGGRQDEVGLLRRSSRAKKVAYHHQDFVYH